MNGTGVGNPLPPHTRGCTDGWSAVPCARNASPAHAGMYRSWIHSDGDSRGFPRTRGDVPVLPFIFGGEVKLPPHTRGCTRDNVREREPLPASPAHAGMYRGTRRNGSFSFRFPRTRGDVPAWSPSRSTTPRLPPHTRGCTQVPPRDGAREAASPAHAGMYPAADSVNSLSGGFPRTRGDVPSSRRGPGAIRRLPPHTRGCTFVSSRSWRDP